MTRSLDDLLAGVPAQDGNGGELLKPSISVKARASDRATQLEKTATNAKRVLEDEARERAEKTARLKAVREKRDTDGED